MGRGELRPMDARAIQQPDGSVDVLVYEPRAVSHVRGGEHSPASTYRRLMGLMTHGVGIEYRGRTFYTDMGDRELKNAVSEDVGGKRWNTSDGFYAFYTEQDDATAFLGLLEDEPYRYMTRETRAEMMGEDPTGELTESNPEERK